MKELLDTLAAWEAEGASIGRAVVVRTFGSAPRPEGAVLLTTSDGRLAGSVSGGCVEGAAYGEIEKTRATGRARVIRYGISDEQAWDVGLACGGTIDVLVEPLVREAAGENPDRLRVCANPSCRWVFYDSSRTGRRRWCDMSTCGNRAKAARHRARKRVPAVDGGAAGTPGRPAG